MGMSSACTCISISSPRAGKRSNNRLSEKCRPRSIRLVMAYANDRGLRARSRGLCDYCLWRAGGGSCGRSSDVLVAWRTDTLMALPTNGKSLPGPHFNTPFLCSSQLGRVSSTPSMALLLDVIARRQVATTPPLPSDFLYQASFHSSPSSLSSRFFRCLRGRFTAAASFERQSGNHLHVTALKWRTGAAEICSPAPSPLHRSQVTSSVYGQHEAGAETAPGKDRLWPALQWSHASIRASSSSVCTHVLRCVTIMVGRQYACDACSYSVL